MYCRGIRGATTVDDNAKEAILRGTRELLALMIRLNGIKQEDVCSVIFSTTIDLDAEFPALAARQFGWMDAALMCNHETYVPGSLQRCVRVLIHWNTEKPLQEIRHVYIRGAEKLRPDRDALPLVDWDELNRWIDQKMKEHKLL
ncbi:MAG: chorismate mutase [Planctomycetaceae bacterium]|jgi:chorismate mutase|nr:chorismate mutase [Planctomycetaceae bacterium]